MRSKLAGSLLLVAGAVVVTAACGSSSPTTDDHPAPDAGRGFGSSSDSGSGSGSSSGGGTSSSGSGSGSSSGGGTSSSGSSSGGATPEGGLAEAGSSGGGGDDGGLGGTTNTYGTIVGSPAVAKLLALTKSCTAASAIASDPGDFVLDNGTVAHVCSLKGGPGDVGGALFFNADMDIDCDGIQTTHCPGTGADKDPSWDNATSFAGPNSAKNPQGDPALASENTPYVVIPEEVVYAGLDQNSGGNIVAVVYKDQIEFAVFGDQIAAEPGEKGEDIGEASVRTAVGLGIPSSPATGGVGSGVTYIVFVGAGTQPADMENIPEIQSLGAQLTESLLQNNP